MNTLFYAPTHPETGVMWDTWLFEHRGTMHLYYLARRGAAWDNISLATSMDGVHWIEHGVVHAKAPDATWMGTGSTWASPHHARDGTFFMNYSEWRGDQQEIFFLESTDLVNWRPLGPTQRFRPDPRWYHVDKGQDSRWDCIFTVPRPGGGLHGYWTASPMGRHGVGFGESDDGVAWRALEPPLFQPPLELAVESGAAAIIDGRCYHLIGMYPGMHTYVADRPEGPFIRARANARLLTAESVLGRGFTYFARFFHGSDGLLVNHHAMSGGGTVHLGLLKRASVDGEGTLRLAWWEGNDILRGRMLGGVDARFDGERGVIAEGEIAIPAQGESPSGLLLETRSGRTAIHVGPGGVVEFSAIAPDGTSTPDSRVDREFPFGQLAHFRLIAKGDLLEFYLDGILMQCYTLPGRLTGEIGTIGSVRNIRVFGVA